MQNLTGAVGENAANVGHDVALIQAILVKIQQPAQAGRAPGPYLASYDGVSGAGTVNAIRQFQGDHVFVNADRTQSVPVANATAGQVRPGDATWVKLLEQVPAAFSDLRVLETGKTVYVAATRDQVTAKISAASALTFAPAFRTRVTTLMNRMFELHGIALGVCRQGDRRTFQTQYELLTSGRGVTNAGPGESNHNFGMAVDIGFDGLRWLRANGEVVTNETSWLHRLDPNQRATGEALIFWEAMRTIGTGGTVGAFRGPVADRPHLQNWSDAGVGMADRLANLLTISGTMRWRGTRGSYSTDFGLGGDYHAVGSAAQIWAGNAQVNADMIARARAAQAQRAAALRPGGAQPPARAALPGAVDIAAMRAELRRQFELADANWAAWTPR